MKKLIIFGNGIMAKIAHFYFSKDSEFEVVAFTVNKEFNTFDNISSIEIVNFEEIQELYPPGSVKFFIAIGPSKMNYNREHIYKKVKKMGYKFASYISSNSKCHSEIGENCFVGDQVIIHPFVEVGNNNVFWDNTLLSHNSIVGDHCYFSPNSNLGAFSEVENNSIIGTGAVIKTNVKIMSKTLVGATSYVSENTLEKGVYGEKTTQLYGCISDKVDIS